MLSAFVSRDFGFGRLLTNDELAKINSERRASTATYTDTHAAMEILGTINKPVLNGISISSSILIYRSKQRSRLFAGTVPQL
jgi:hypothetical protein